jgi:hypothetical protein
MVSPGKFKLSRRIISRANGTRAPPHPAGPWWLGSPISFVLSLAKTVAVAVPISIAVILINVIYTTWGSLVIVPMQIVGDYKNDIDLGSQISARLAYSTNHFSAILNEQQSNNSRRNTYDILDNYILNMPRINFRNTKEYLSFGIENITLVGVQVPIYKIVSMVIPYFISDSVAGTVQNGGNVLR